MEGDYLRTACLGNVRSVTGRGQRHRRVGPAMDLVLDLVGPALGFEPWPIPGAGAGQDWTGPGAGAGAGLEQALELELDFGPGLATRFYQPAPWDPRLLGEERGRRVFGCISFSFLPGGARMLLLRGRADTSERQALLILAVQVLLEGEMFPVCYA